MLKKRFAVGAIFLSFYSVLYLFYPASYGSDSILIINMFSYLSGIFTAVGVIMLCICLFARKIDLMTVSSLIFMALSTFLMCISATLNLVEMLKAFGVLGRRSLGMDWFFVFVPFLLEIMLFTAYLSMIIITIAEIKNKRHVKKTFNVVFIISYASYCSLSFLLFLSLLIAPLPLDWHITLYIDAYILPAVLMLTERWLMYPYRKENTMSQSIESNDTFIATDTIAEEGTVTTSSFEANEDVATADSN